MQPEVVIFVVLFVKKLVDFIKYATNGDMNGLITQLSAWLAGVAAVYITIATTAGTEGLDVDAWSRILWGVSLASGAGVVNDTLKAINKGPQVPPLVSAPPVPIISPSSPAA